ncbi:uncharacterized protein LOC110838638 [Zootermopsis nevadensis]|uniref:uncharacterized protein LOC110838638 n=1 Tax=Zootermopsis nevadensis TaxID=136037 RepID=UPI000B8E3D4D|nr:uncharacterized protein LOC110838638 [Zootermopsis nevadensis]
MSSHLCTHNFSRNLTTSGTELSCAKDAIGESSIRDKQKVGNFNISNNLQSSTMEEHILPSSVLQDNGCQKQSESNVSISTTLLPLTVKCTTDKAHTLDELSTNGFHTGSETSTYEVQKEIQQHAPPNEEEKCSDHIPFDSKQVYEHVRQSSDMLSSMTKEISHNEEVAGKESYNIEEPQKPEQQIFISSYYLGYPNTTCNPQLLLQKECVKIYEIYNDCKPMNESLNAEESGESITEYDKGINTDSGICENVYEECDPCLWKYNVNISDSGVLRHYKNVPLYQAYNFGTVKHSNAKVEENIYTETEHIYEEINFCLKPKTQRNETEVSVADMEMKRPSGSSQRGLWVDIKEVIDSGLLDKLDANQIALHEAKYEIITSEASYYKSLLILDTVFITSKELTDRSVLPEKDYNTIFSSIKKVKQCSKKFLEVLLRGWQEDLKLGYLCQTITKFVYLGYFQDYVNCCASQIYIHETLQHLKLTNPKFSSALSKLQADPVCQMFLLETFLILPMQRVTRLPLLVEAILRRLSSDHIEHSVWSKVLIQFQKIVKDCNEAAGRAQTLATNDSTLHVQPNNTTQTLNRKQLSQEKKKQPAIWNIFGIRRQKII